MTNSMIAREKSIIKRRRTKLTGGDRIYLGCVYLLLFMFMAAVIYPLIYVVSCSFSSPEVLVQGQVFFLPVKPTLQGTRLYFGIQASGGYYNTIVYTVSGTIIGL